ncbi:MMPL family transporter [Pseudomarimonas arenosa]|uniref:MMPL family transporter n=1 Tax=Pseudomarimonas arenosa TaxID=2774145 RepID=A0AAW3ZIZ6_9GAMM|nr:MMPL family transporter [Pseudomarimonas arenosa]MBD8525410.1 MMPL family transporter [Pseudomarimonas arenosa]
MSQPKAGAVQGRHVARLAICLVVLGLLAWALASRLQLSGDLRLFMPAPRSDAQRLLIEQLGEGPGARLLLVALHGDERDRLAERSRALREALVDSDHFVWSGNGDEGLDALPEALLDYRYLLSPGAGEGVFAEPALRHALEQRLLDLASPAAAMIAPLIAADPTLETLRVIETWQPAAEPERHDGVWMSRAGEALLVLETAAPGFDPSGQQAALQALRQAYCAVLEAESAAAGRCDETMSSEVALDLGLEVSGPGAFAERMANRTRGDASFYGSLAGLGLFVLLLLAYRSVWLPLVGIIPLLFAGLGGLLVTAWLFGTVHGITLAFGLTLLGVAQDYPVHLFSHRRAGEPAQQSVRRIWPTLATGAFSSALAYLVFFFTGVDGLQQLAVLTVSGLALAALATRFVLPWLLPLPAEVPSITLSERPTMASPRRRVGLAAGVASVLLAMLFGLPSPGWQEDLAALTPLPPELLQRDRQLRQALAAPDVRWLLQLQGDSTDSVLQASEALMPALDQLVQQGAITGYDLAARYLPSAQRQLQRQAALPAADQLRASLRAASQGLPFKADAFAPFLAALERARQLPPLQVEALQGTALELRLGGLLLAPQSAAGASRHSALVQLQGPADLAALQALADAHPDLALIDLKSVANSLASAWRTQVLWAMLLAALILSVLVAISLGSLRRASRVLLPVALGTLFVVTILHSAGVPLSLFHLVAMVLGAGLGLDYALFFERARQASAERGQTLHALVLCATSTLWVFALLALSEIPVLRHLGVTVALGVVAHFGASYFLLGAPGPAPENRR